MKKAFIFSCYFLFGFYEIISAQEFPRDTSYTFHSAYQKYIKDYPFISAVSAPDKGRIFHKKNIAYKNIGARDLQLDVFSPIGNTKKLPAVIMVHGGGWISGDRSLLHILAANIAEEGFVVITPEYRLSPEATYPAAIFDINTAIKWVKNHSEELGIDSNKIALLGTSAGGQIAALTAFTAGNSDFEDPADTSNTVVNVQAVVDVDGILAFIHPDSREGTVAAKWLGGNQEEARDVWIKASPLSHIDEKSPPILFIGSENSRFLAGNEEVIQRFEEYGIKTQKYVFEDAPHSFWLFHPWFEPTADYISNFLKDLFTSQ